MEIYIHFIFQEIQTPYIRINNSESASIFVEEREIIRNVTFFLIPFLWVSSFYIFNIKVPKKLQKTFDVLQYEFFKIPTNPKFSLEQIRARVPRNRGYIDLNNVGQCI